MFGVRFAIVTAERRLPGRELSRRLSTNSVAERTGAQAIRLRPGQNVRVQLVDSEDRNAALPSEFKQARFTGKLIYIDPGVSLVGERNVRVWAEVANQGGLLRHGLIAEITIDTASTR